MANLITFLIIAALVGSAGRYIYRAKKRGVKCIGCPAGETCGKRSGSACSGSCASCSGCQHRA